MSTGRARPQPGAPLFVDTGAFFAYHYRRANRHDRARAVFAAIEDGTLPYGTLYTSRYVLAELATLLLRKAGHEPAVSALTDVLESSTFNVPAVDGTVFSDAVERFERFDDQRISFVDHVSATLARHHDIEHVFAFDSDFTTLGFTRVPADTGEV